MHAATQQFLSALAESDIKYSILREAEAESSDDDILNVGFSGDNTSVQIRIFFDSDNESVAFRVFNLAKVPSDKTETILETINKENCRFRWAKFCLNEKESSIQMELDGVFRSHDVAEICKELLFRAVNIADEAYPDFMKAIWA